MGISFYSVCNVMKRKEKESLEWNENCGVANVDIFFWKIGEIWKTIFPFPFSKFSTIRHCETFPCIFCNISKYLCKIGKFPQILWVDATWTMAVSRSTEAGWKLMNLQPGVMVISAVVPYRLVSCTTNTGRHLWVTQSKKQSNPIL